ncbi:MAG TPA: 5-(carboxyamino)imidazole ribonucleotide mutase [Acidimicrobiales bacterium]|nr:5-(carboxyamino)imidazole ribonucleotide mutase [Acidimicrobiales bacterium]
MAKVAILMGSANDEGKMAGAKEMLERFGVEVDMHVMSAHRNPHDVGKFATGARDAGYSVLIGGAGLAAHLAGVLAAHSSLPVIGVPLSGGIANGLDALLATVQMPSGIPVATVAVDGSKNAGILAAQIIGVSDPDVAKKIDEFKANGAR